LLICLRVVAVNPAPITSDDPGQEGFVIGGELTKFSADVLAVTRCMPNSSVRIRWNVP
jgi:hypothetical protein